MTFSRLVCRRFVESVVQEELTPDDISVDLSSSSFSLAEFNGLKTPTGRLQYARKFLEPIGSSREDSEGTSRAVFILSQDKVLKVALLKIRAPETFKKAIAQNKAEIENSKTIPNLVTKTYNHAPDFSWVVAERVVPLKSNKEFLALTGFHFGSLMMFFHDAHLDNFSVEKFMARFKHTKSVYQDMEAMVKWSGFQDVLITLRSREKGLHHGDFSVVSHWGKTQDGRVVLLDHGATKEVISTHYMPEGKTIHEDLFDVLKGKQKVDPDLSYVQQQHLLFSQGLTNSIQNLYDRLEQARIQLLVVSEIKQEVEAKTKNQLPTDTVTLFGTALQTLSQAAVVEYQEFAKRSVVQHGLGPDEPTIKESLTLPTIASFAYSAAKNLSASLQTLEEVARKFKSPKLLKGLKVAGMVAKRVDSKGGTFKFGDDISLATYKALWDRGFQTSKTFLSDQDYLSGKDNARLLSEGLFYKLNMAFASYGAIQTLLSICVAYLKEAEVDLGAREWVEQLYGKMSPGVVLR